MGAWTLNFDFRENRLHDSVKTRPICYPQTSGVQYPLSLYGCIQLLQLNDFWVVLVSPLSIGYSPTAVLISGKHGEELAGNEPRTILTLPSVIILSAVCIAQN